MSTVLRRIDALPAVAVVMAVVLLTGTVLAGYRYTVFSLLITLVPALALVFLVFRTRPVWIFSAAIVLSIFAGHWEEIGIPGALAPDRWLVVLGVTAVLLRARASAERPPLRVELAHLLLLLASLYTICSAFVADTLFERESAFQLFERFGVMPFLVFLVAQAVFRTEADRRILMGTLVALGGYLGVTALLETVGAHGVVLPRYIADPEVGIHFGRARGPFVEAVTNGVALYACALASGLALARWENRLARRGALVVLILCAGGLLFTLQRSVWLGSLVGTGVILLAAPELRRWIVPALVGGAAVICVSLLVIPGFADTAGTRRGQEETVWERKNQFRAAVNMIDDRPLFGFGWEQFRRRSVDYYELSPDYPLTGTRLDIHNVYLLYGAELGLIGLSLWLCALLVAVLGAITRRGPPELRGWRIALGGFAVFYLIVIAFVPGQLFPNLMLWLLTGAVWGGALQSWRPPVQEAARVPSSPAGELARA